MSEYLNYNPEDSNRELDNITDLSVNFKVAFKDIEGSNLYSPETGDTNIRFYYIENPVQKKAVEETSGLDKVLSFFGIREMKGKE
ncbi:hypothetical protein [Microaceticoccus formicicus]|uniref:hypothetical protein n=1 Tax=Microaceticoccus formicicus TaxID=3118105 RepID=UPI003CD03BA2|nr:hypothetical protein VZL98_07590 [Peptoniphilaceae bacterium AMB_02]